MGWILFGVFLACLAYAVACDWAEADRRRRLIREFGEDQYEAGRRDARKELGFG